MVAWRVVEGGSGAIREVVGRYRRDPSTLTVTVRWMAEQRKASSGFREQVEQLKHTPIIQV